MNNLFCTRFKIDKRYDLKGSTQGRTTYFPPDKQRDDTVALKDLDFLNEKGKFQVGRDVKKLLMEVIEKDANFFAKVGIIDYSLLVGIHEFNLHKDNPKIPIISVHDSASSQDNIELEGYHRN